MIEKQLPENPITLKTFRRGMVIGAIGMLAGVVVARKPERRGRGNRRTTTKHCGYDSRGCRGSRAMGG